MFAQDAEVNLTKPIYRMSGVGDCARALSAERLGYESETIPIWLNRAAEEGKRHEIWIKEQLVAEGYEVFADQEELVLDYPNFTLVGHIDGKVKKDGATQLLEIKSMSQYEFDRWMKEGFEGFQSYAAQITCYLKGTELPKFLYLCKNRSNGYIDRNLVVGAPADFDEIIAKLNRVEECVTIGSLVEMECLPESLQCRRCFYKSLCLPAPTEYKSVPESELREACDKWRKAKALEAEAKVLMDSAKEAFLNQTETSGQKKWRFDELAISKVEVKGSVAYSKANLLEAFTKEQLEPAAEMKLPYSFIKVIELRGEEK